MSPLAFEFLYYKLKSDLERLEVVYKFSKDDYQCSIVHEELKEVKRQIKVLEEKAPTFGVSMETL